MGVKYFYTVDELKTLIKDTKPFLKQPTQDELTEYPNKGQIFQLVNNVHYALVF